MAFMEFAASTARRFAVTRTADCAVERQSADSPRHLLHQGAAWVAKEINQSAVLRSGLLCTAVSGRTGPQAGGPVPPSALERFDEPRT